MLLILFPALLRFLQTLEPFVRFVEPKLLFMIIWPVPKVCLELGASLVEGDGVPEGTDNGIRSGERETLGNESNGINGIPN